VAERDGDDRGQRGVVRNGLPVVRDRLQVEKLMDRRGQALSEAIWQKPPRARRFGAVNIRGMATFYRREVHRGFKIWGITLAAPAIRALLFAGVFALVVGATGKIVLGMPFLEFLISGLVAVAILERSFESAAFSMVYDKTEGIFGDIATAPLTPGEVILAYAGASVTGALIVGTVVWLVLLPLGGQVPAEPLALLFWPASRLSSFCPLFFCRACFSPSTNCPWRCSLGRGRTPYSISSMGCASASPAAATPIR
jgi:hypothetical protein